MKERSFLIVVANGNALFLGASAGGVFIESTPLRRMARKPGRYKVLVKEARSKGFVRCVIRRPCYEFLETKMWGQYGQHTLACPRLCRAVGYNPNKEEKKTLYVKAVPVKLKPA